jgi:hypothetical protein
VPVELVNYPARSRAERERRNGPVA